MDWTAYGLLAAIAAFTLFVWGHAIGYTQGHEDGERFQARQNSYGAAYDAMEPTPEPPAIHAQVDRIVAAYLDDEQARG